MRKQNVPWKSAAKEGGLCANTMTEAWAICPWACDIIEFEMQGE